jgi:Fic family protein
MTPNEPVHEESGRSGEGAVVPISLLDDFRLTPAAMRYYAVALREPELDLEEIARRIKASPKTARRARTALLSGGWMEIVTTRGPQGSRTEHRCLQIASSRAS